MESSTNSGSPGGTSAGETCSRGNVPIVVIEVESLTTWQENDTAKGKDYATTGLPKHMVVQRKKVGIKRKGRLVWAH